MLKFISLLKGPPGGWTDNHPQLLHPITSHSFSGLIQKERKALEAHGVELEEGWEDEAQDRMCLQLPEGWCHDPDNPQPYESALKRLGRALWKKLHEKAKSLPVQLTEGDKQELKNWLALWERAIPNFSGCACLKHWREVRTSLPPVFDSGPEFHRWSVAAHDLVSERIGKPKWTGS